MSAIVVAVQRHTEPYQALPSDATDTGEKRKSAIRLRHSFVGDYAHFSCLESRGSGADGLLRRQIFDDPTLAGLTSRLVDAYADLGRIDEAQAALRRALQQVQAPNAKEQLTEKQRDVDKRTSA